MKVLSGGDIKESPIDNHYHGLHCTLSPVDKEDEVFATVEKYVHQTHAKTHNQYRLQVQDIFLVEREGETDHFKDVGNRYDYPTCWDGVLRRFFPCIHPPYFTLTPVKVKYGGCTPP